MSEKRLVSNFLPAGGAFDALQNFEVVTYTGNGGTQKITGYIRKGAAFNGSSSIITATRSFSSNSAYSVSGWVNIDDVSGYTIVALFWQITGTSITGFYLEQNSGVCKLHLEHKGETNQKITYTFPSKPSGWNHFAATFNGTNSGSIYLNGSSVVTDSLDPKSDVSQTFYIGGGYPYNNVTYYRAGKIDQVRYFNKALSSGEVTTLYGETYSSSTKSTTDIFGDDSGVALYELDEDADDTDGVDGKFNNAAVFNGSSSYIDTGISSLTNNFTFSAWLNADDLTTSYRWIFGNWASSSQDIYLLINNDGTIELNADGNDGTTGFGSAGDFTLNTWHHLVVSMNAGTYTVYLDNTSLGSGTTTNTTFNNGSNYQLGKVPNSSINEWSGKIDQVRIYSSALDSDDVAELYAESADVPTTNLVAHYKLDGNATDETGSYNGTATNITYTGYNGTPTNVNFLGMAFQPDLVWIKDRDRTNHHTLFDSIRGDDSVLYSDLTNAVGSGEGFASFDSNGFTLDTGYTRQNANGVDYVAWGWKAGGTAVSNTDGDVTSSVSANQDAGFSIVKVTDKTNTVESIGHGLSSAPEFIITKLTETTQIWLCYHKDTGTNGYLSLNGTGAFTSLSGMFSAVDSTTFTTNTAAATSDMIAYCFHSVDGYQKVGSYSGSGGAGNKQTTGFQPRFVLIKAYSSTSGWFIFDSERSGEKRLSANTSGAESTETGSGINFLSDGFDFDAADGNNSGVDWIYLAIA